MGREGQRGRRCEICTGCGLCPGVLTMRANLKVLTESSLFESAKSLENKDGLRLIAADIGTTTIAMELYLEDGSVEDRFAIVNPQTAYGADVLSRIQAARDPELQKHMMQMVKSALAQGAERFLKWKKEGERFVCVIAANTTMSYLLMGWDPAELGQAPFAASHLAGARFDLELSNGERISCLLVPGFSAFVGGDLLSGAVACDMAQAKELTLLVDLGTNGEILLGNRDGILATATAAGPAFEGGVNRGIWGADLVKLTARLLEEGILDETGLLKEPYFTKGIRIGNVTVTKESIRSIQLAKAAIQTGIQTLLNEKGIGAESVDRVILAGGFGYFLNPADAVRVGLLPAALEAKAIAGGNTALLGAKKIGRRLLTSAYWKNNSLWAPELPPVRVINLAQQEAFAEGYLEAMALRSI